MRTILLFLAVVVGADSWAAETTAPPSRRRGRGGCVQLPAGQARCRPDVVQRLDLPGADRLPID